MILVPFLGLFMSPDSSKIIDDFGTEHDMEALILMDDPPLVIDTDAMQSAWRFEFDGIDEWQPLLPQFANLFYSNRLEWWQGDYHVRVTVQPVANSSA